jgi:hypothetical protein
VKYKKLQMIAYNDSPHEEDSFHCECVITGEPRFDSLMESTIKPMAYVIFHRMIPEMPDLGNDGKGNPTLAGMGKLIEWERKWFDPNTPAGLK